MQKRFNDREGPCRSRCERCGRCLDHKGCICCGGHDCHDGCREKEDCHDHKPHHKGCTMCDVINWPMFIKCVFGCDMHPHHPPHKKEPVCNDHIPVCCITRRRFGRW